MINVSVYFNLNRKCLSIRAEEGPAKGRVIAHAQTAALGEVTFKVSEAGRQRVLKEQRKNVHAFVRGTLIAIEGKFTEAGKAAGVDREVMRCPILKTVSQNSNWQQVTYNPYRFDSFVTKEWHEAVTSAGAAILRGREVEASGLVYRDPAAPVAA